MLLMWLKIIIHTTLFDGNYNDINNSHINSHSRITVFFTNVSCILLYTLSLEGGRLRIASFRKTLAEISQEFNIIAFIEEILADNRT